MEGTVTPLAKFELIWLPSPATNLEEKREGGKKNFAVKYSKPEKMGNTKVPTPHHIMIFEKESLQYSSHILKQEQLKDVFKLYDAYTAYTCIISTSQEMNHNWGSIQRVYMPLFTK